MKIPCFSKENTASISDEEILFSELPDYNTEYLMSAEEGIILKKIIIKAAEKKSNKLVFKLRFNDDTNPTDIILKNLKKTINEINNNTDHKIRKLLNEIDLDFKKINSKDLEELNVYSGKDKHLFDEYKKYVVVETEEKKIEN